MRKGLAWDGANLSLLYLIVFVTSAALPWRRATAAALLAAYGLFAASVGVIELVRAAAAHDPAASFQLGRFAAPFGYQNAACAWYLMAAWPMLLVASRRGVPRRGEGALDRCALRAAGAGAALREPWLARRRADRGARVSGARSEPGAEPRVWRRRSAPGAACARPAARRLSGDQGWKPGSRTPSRRHETSSCSRPLRASRSALVVAVVDRRAERARAASGGLARDRRGGRARRGRRSSRSSR